MGEANRKKIVVTGNEGYIGSVLTSHLVRLGHEVVGLDLGVFREVALFPRTSPAEQLYKDVREVDAADLAGADVVMHLAALSNDPLGDSNPDLTYEINYRASVRLAEVAKEAGVERFLFSSSCSMYGVNDSDFVTEEMALDPRTAYARSKVLVEQDVVELADEKFSPVFLRNATVFGSSPRLRLDLVVNDLVATGYTTDTIRILSDGTPWRPHLHVQDCAEAFAFLMGAPADVVRGEAFNVGDDASNMQIKAVAERVQQVMPGVAVSIEGAPSPDVRSYKVGFSKLASLGWRQFRSIETGTKELVNVFEKTGFDERLMAEDKFWTLKHYQKLMGEGVLTGDMRVRENVSV